MGRLGIIFERARDKWITFRIQGMEGEGLGNAMERVALTCGSSCLGSFFTVDPSSSAAAAVSEKFI